MGHYTALTGSAKSHCYGCYSQVYLLPLTNYIKTSWYKRRCDSYFIHEKRKALNQWVFFLILENNISQSSTVDNRSHSYYFKQKEILHKEMSAHIIIRRSRKASRFQAGPSEQQHETGQTWGEAVLPSRRSWEIKKWAPQLLGPGKCTIHLGSRSRGHGGWAPEQGCLLVKTQDAHFNLNFRSTTNIFQYKCVSYNRKYLH